MKAGRLRASHPPHGDEKCVQTYENKGVKSASPARRSKEVRSLLAQSALALDALVLELLPDGEEKNGQRRFD